MKKLLIEIKVICGVYKLPEQCWFMAQNRIKLQIMVFKADKWENLRG